MAKRTSSKIPKYKRPPRHQRGFVARLFGFLVKLVIGLILLSILWVLAYRFINPPITATMIGDIAAGRGATRDWMDLDTMDRDMVRAAIGAEDSKFCAHRGFDFDAIQDAVKRNESGGRIRGGSTISQQTAKNAFLWQGGGYARKGAGRNHARAMGGHEYEIETVFDLFNAVFNGDAGHERLHKLRE